MFVSHGVRGVIVVGLIAVVFGCGEGQREQVEPKAELLATDFYPSGRLKPHAYHKSNAGYPDFTQTDTRWMGDFPEACNGLRGESAYACAEQIFWHAFQIDVDWRGDAHQLLGEMIAEFERTEALSEELLAVLYWRKAQLGTALITEQELVTGGDYTNETLVAYGPGLTADMKRGLTLDPNNKRIETWLITNELFGAVLFDIDVNEKAEGLLELYEEDPGFVVASAGPPLIAMPLASGWPQRIADMYLDFDKSMVEASCDGACFAAPPMFAKYTREGNDYTIAEIMARVGDQDLARFYLERSLSHETAKAWPQRIYAEAALGDLDGFVGKFAARGEDEPVFDLMDINGKNACMVCHDPR